MADYATEEEQLEALKRWWRENGRSVLLGAALGILALVGWRGWDMYREQQSLAASAIYDRIESASGYEDAIESVERLRADYANTSYAVLGALQAAGLAVGAGNLDAAVEWLEWAQANANSPAIAALARLRTARVLFEQGDAERALGLLDAETPEAYTGLYASLRGDILSERGDLEGALAAYQRSLDAEVGPVDRTLVERRINRLRGQVSTGSGETTTDSDP
ncbi:MAG: tetratricopeptide repeat protein [Halofilum sp. (in: g-proteobacteria)]|nr:tetratricopeptide repeat protein [Halofilum sp. (in: g-proteobacteria)]